MVLLFVSSDRPEDDIRPRDLFQRLFASDHLQRRLQHEEEVLLQEHRIHPRLCIRRNDHLHVRRRRDHVRIHAGFSFHPFHLTFQSFIRSQF